MRIVAGQLKGMNLSQSVSKNTRPTSDAVRESIFNILSSRIDFENKKVADLYAGTGALGIEAFSRGAASVNFIETDKEACKSISENIAKIEKQITNASQQLLLERAPVLTFVQNINHQRSFDCVLADPPYEYDVETEVIDIVSSGGYLVYETTAKKLVDVEKEFANCPRTEEIIVSRKMGNTGVVVLRAI